MRTVKTLLFVSVLFLLTAESCAQKKAAIPEGVTKNQVDSISYALGVMIGENFKQMNMEYVDFDTFKKAVQDVLNGDEKAMRLDATAAQIYFQQFMTQRREYAGKKNLEEGQKFLDNNKKNADVVELPSGLQYKIITPGTGAKPTSAEDIVVVKYRGTTIDGKEFDAWDKHGENPEPARFPLNQVIAGWTEGLQQFNEGTKAILYIPSDLAYGERGNRGIDPNATLIFEVELLKVEPQPQAQPQQ